MADKKLKRPDFILQKDFFVKNDANEQETGPKKQKQKSSDVYKRQHWRINWNLSLATNMKGTSSCLLVPAFIKSRRELFLCAICNFIIGKRK